MTPYLYLVQIQIRFTRNASYLPLQCAVMEFFISITVIPDPVTSLECYVCTRQEGNIEKCLSTVRTCAVDEDTCQTELRWGSKCIVDSVTIGKIISVELYLRNYF